MLIIPFRPDASWRHRPIGTVAVMVSLLLIHVVWGRGDPEVLLPYLLNFQSLDLVQWLTSGLLHANWVHLLGNLIFLFVFGAIVEDFLGRWFVPVFLLLTFLSGGLEQCLSLMQHREGYALGASSAIYALVAMATLWAPRSYVSTFIWIYIRLPQVVRIRVLWLAGYFMVIQIFSVWLQDGEPSSEFLHACGIVVGLALGFLCLRLRWVDTNGEDLMAPERSQKIISTPIHSTVSWEEQSARLNAAVAKRENRIALAAYDVLRRAYPTRLPDMSVLEYLIEVCEERLDFHRAAAIAERAIVAGPVSDLLRFCYARINGQHLGHIEAGLAQLNAINREMLPDDALHEYDQLRARLERRYRGEAATTSFVSHAALAVILMCGMSGAAFSAVLEEVEPSLITSQITVGNGATIKLPKDVAYISWQEIQRFLILPPSSDVDVDPMGVIVTFANLDKVSANRARVSSRADWERQSFEFLFYYAPIQVYWVEGWIDASVSLPDSTQLLTDLQLQATVINKRQLFGPGVHISYDRWLREPIYNAQQGTLAWAIYMGWQMGGIGISAGPGIYVHAYNACHLGAKGTVQLVCFDANPPIPNSREITSGELVQLVSSQVTWAAGTGFTATRATEVGERKGGLRHVIQPRLLMNGSNDELDYHRGLGFTWILILVPLALTIFIMVRWLKGVMQIVKPVEKVQENVPGRCSACGSQVSLTDPRCFSCGTSLIRRPS